MAQGGARPNSGRPRGSKNPPETAEKKAKRATTRTMAQRSRAEAAKTGELPHEWLLRVMRGEPIKQRKQVTTYYKSGPKRGEIASIDWVEEDYYASFAERVDAAKHAAPFYTPRLATQTVKTDENTATALTEVMKELSRSLPG